MFHIVKLAIKSNKVHQVRPKVGWRQTQERQTQDRQQLNIKVAHIETLEVMAEC